MANERGERLLAVSVAGVAGPDSPLPDFALLACVVEGQALLVRNRRRAVWELPGGFIDPGESAEACALREFREETGQTATRLCLFARIEIASPPARDGTCAIRHGALFTAGFAGLLPFEQSDEIQALGFWPVHAPPAGTSAIDAALLALLAPSAQVQSVSPSRR